MKLLQILLLIIVPTVAQAAAFGGGIKDTKDPAFRGGGLQDQLFASSVRLQAIMRMVQLDTDSPAPAPSPTPNPDDGGSKPAVGHSRRCICRGTGLITTPDGVAKMTCPGRRGDLPEASDMADLPSGFMVLPTTKAAGPQDEPVCEKDNCPTGIAKTAPATFAAAPAVEGRQIVIATKEPCVYCKPAHEVERKLRELGFPCGAEADAKVRLLDLAQHPAEFRKYDITSTPTILILDDDKVRSRLVGQIACTMTDDAIGKLFTSAAVTPAMTAPTQVMPAQPQPVRQFMMTTPKTYAPMPTYSSRRMRRVR